MKVNTTIAVAIILIIPLLLLSSNSRDVEVSTSDVNHGQGSRGTIIVNASGGGDYTSIQAAIDSAQDGDTIYVNCGTYYENINISKPISLIGEHKNRTIINGGNNGNVINITSNRVNISKFTIIEAGNEWYNSGIQLYQTNNCQIADINASNNKIGIYLYHSQANTITNTEASNNTYGLYIYRGNNNVVNKTTCSNNYKSVILSQSHNNIIGNNTCDFGNEGIAISHSNNNTVINNTVASQDYAGIELEESTNNTIMDNVCLKSEDGINLYYSCNNIIRNNNCTSNQNYGIRSIFSNNNIFKKNILSYNRNGISFRNSSNNNISENKVFSNADGICLSLSTNGNTVYKNNASNNDYGIILYYSDDNHIGNNICNSNEKNGITIDASHINTITNNTCNANWVGIVLKSAFECDLTYNICNFNDNYGIGLEWSSEDNTISNNICSLNANYGVYLNEYSYGNTIYHNTFIKNKGVGKQGLDNGTDNQWDTSNIGNYWSDWTRPDADDDGIVDKPYNLRGSANAHDNFPLVNPISALLIIADAGDDVTIDKHQTVTFNGSNSWGYPYITNNTWSFTYNSNPIFLYGSTPSFTFHIPGTYIVILTVRNESGNSDTDQMIVFVRDVEPPIDNEPPIPDAGPDGIIGQGEMFIFNASGSLDNVGIVSYTWNFTYNNTNVILFGISTSFKFDIPGSYDIYLNVTDARGNWATDVMVLTVRDSTWPVAQAGADIVIDQHDTVQFDGTESYDNVGIINYTWSFIDGFRDGEELTLVGGSVKYTFHYAGVFLITLNVTDGEGNWDEDTLTVTVRDITPPMADAGENMTINAGEIAFFDGIGSFDNVKIINYTWSFTYNDTTKILFGSRPEFTYHIPGNYTVTLRVSDAMDLSGEDSIWVKVLPKDGNQDTEKPHAAAGDDLIIQANTTFSFDASASHDNVGIVNYTWSFYYDGMRITLYDPKSTFLFEIPGNYSITLMVMDGQGNIGEDTITITVKPRDDETPPNDNAGDKGKGSEISPWFWLILVILIVAIIVVLIYVIWMKKEDKVEQSLEDELGRVKKSGESDSE